MKIMQIFYILTGLVSILQSQQYYELDGNYSLLRPPQWPINETCCYLYGANITSYISRVVGKIYEINSLVMGPCASQLPGAIGSAGVYIDGPPFLQINRSVMIGLSFKTLEGEPIQERQYNLVYSVEESPAPINVLTFTSNSDPTCTFQLKNDKTVPSISKASSFFNKFLAKMEKQSSNQLKMFFSQQQDDFIGKFSLWRPPTWQNYSNCCYLQGANVTYDKIAQEFTYQAYVMGPCAAFLPGTFGTMKSKVISGTPEENNLTLKSTFYTTSGEKIKDLTFTITTDIELTPAPVNIYVYHNIQDGNDASCDFKLRKDID